MDARHSDLLGARMNISSEIRQTAIRALVVAVVWFGLGGVCGWVARMLWTAA